MYLINIARRIFFDNPRKVENSSLDFHLVEDLISLLSEGQRSQIKTKMDGLL
jgi:hypothetical protein